MKKIFLCCLLLLSLFSFKKAVSVVVPNDWSLIPEGFPEESGLLSVASRTFHLLFVTSDTTTAVATRIIHYNTFVQTAAERNATLTNINGTSFANKFNAIGSTQFIDARDNTNTNPASHSNGGYPIYFLNGHKVAEDYIDFYDGKWVFPATKILVREGEFKIFTYYNELGEDEEFGLPAIYEVWTGSDKDGTKQENGYLGSAMAYRGNNNEGAELSWGSIISTTAFPLYGLSPSFTVDIEDYTITTVTLKGNNPDFVIKGNNYLDPGINALGNFIGQTETTDFAIFARTMNAVDENILGVYEITYTIADSAGSETILTRSVYVVDVNENKLDIDRNGTARMNTDGLMIKNYASNPNRKAFAKRFIAKNAVLKTEAAINNYLDFIDAENIFDVDLGGDLDKNDGEVIGRYLFGSRGFFLTNGLTFSGTRTSPASITQYLNGLRSGN